MDGRHRLAFNVRRLRSGKLLTQEQLAIDAGVAAPYLSRIERAAVNPTIDILDRLAIALAVPVNELLGPVDNRSKPEKLRAGRKPSKPV